MGRQPDSRHLNSLRPHQSTSGNSRRSSGSASATSIDDTAHPASGRAAKSRHWAQRRLCIAVLAKRRTAATRPIDVQRRAAKHPTVQGFLAAARAAGITGLDPAMLEDGYKVCWELWNQHSPANQVAAGLQRDYPTLTTDQAAHFVIAAYQNLCPVPGAYDYWAYSTS